jgi:hypothetical protein
MNDIHITLIKQIDRSGEENNFIKIKDDSLNMQTEKDWEDIDSFYKFNKRYYICPKGNNFVNMYTNNFQIMKPEFIADEKQDWELKCNYHTYNKMLFFTFLNSDKNNLMYYFDVNYESIYKINSFQLEKCDKILDYIWIESDSGFKKIIGLFSYNSAIYLRKIRFNVISNYKSNTY